MSRIERGGENGGTRAETIVNQQQYSKQTKKAPKRRGGAEQYKGTNKLFSLPTEEALSRQ